MMLVSTNSPPRANRRRNKKFVRQTKESKYGSKWGSGKRNGGRKPRKAPKTNEGKQIWKQMGQWQKKRRTQTSKSAKDKRRKANMEANGAVAKETEDANLEKRQRRTSTCLTFFATLTKK